MNVETMGWAMTDVAPAGHINAGLTVAQRMEKYAVDPTKATAYNSLLSKEHAEARAAGLAPDIPITPEAAALFTINIEAQKRAQQIRWAMYAAAGVGVLWIMTRGKRRRR
jgi:hypothetical protein